MTIKEKLETIKGKKIAIWCEEEDEAIGLVSTMDSVTNQSDSEVYFGDYDDMCYDLFTESDWDYGETKWYIKNGYKIISFKDFINGCTSNFIKLTQQDINAILDEKYGKDNWVMG